LRACVFVKETVRERERERDVVMEIDREFICI
jgi:hypothetical protein